MIKIAICDDSIPISKELVLQIGKYPRFTGPFEVDSYSTGAELLQVMREDKKYDIIFMDIRLGEVELGHEIGVALKDIHAQVLMIYMSSYGTYSKDVSNAEPLMFLEKPLTQEKVNTAIDKAIRRMNDTHRKYYPYYHDGNYGRIDLNNVLYIESYYKKVRVKMKGNGIIKISGRTGKSFAQICDEVKNMYPVFCQPKKSLLVNALHVEIMNRTFLMIEGQKILLSRDFDEKCVKDYLDISKIYIF